MLDLYPTGICSVVSDTYNVWTVLTDFAEKLKSRILSRDGKVVFRPDSGNPEYIICGDPSAKFGTPEFLGAIRLLDMKFGSTINKKGYRILNPKIGLIYGDGMYYERYERTLSRLKNMGYAASNLTIGVGGILRNHSRDTFGFAIKATNVVVNGESRDIEKDPITDHKKKSHKGLMRLDKDENGQFFTKDNATKEEAAGGYLETVFRDGKITKEYTLSEIRERVKSYL
jgi:nicotinamide phosphoribosyltransferase